MKNNTGKLAKILDQALLETPDDFALSDVRYYLHQAINKLREVEKKRTKREQVLKEAEETTEINGNQGTIDYLDDMIHKERQKLKEIAERKTNKNASGNEFQTFHD